ncbi:hypothetical protein JVT61DRAFT_15274 [Boletus reticuloceps]|uniref:DNA primase n=1 Tax=Boletus reticuloceps TaxID=495285 RepID=A0A8I3AA18_9AGAM|nr:hypothetical protein JVT61DRAFT_15274 [Boletus reticuloceps]
MDLTDDQRRALVSALTVVEGGKEMVKKVNVRTGNKLPPSLWGALSILRVLFSPLILHDQDCFGPQDGWEMLLQLVPEKSIVEKLRTEWLKDPGRPSVQKWNDLGTLCPEKQRHVLEDIILQYTYPRLDAEVSKHRNHLLKAPFCVHPKTGRVCVPVDPENIDRFDPRSVPTVGQLLRELDAAGEGADWEKTSLKPYGLLHRRPLRTPPPNSDASTLLFGFLLSALSIFGVFMTSAIIWNRLVARRHAIEAMLAMSPPDSPRIRRPMMWDILIKPDKQPPPSWLEINSRMRFSSEFISDYADGADYTILETSSIEPTTP